MAGNAECDLGLRPPSRWGDRLFIGFTALMAFSAFGMLVMVGWKLAAGAWPALQAFGWRFVVSSDWDPVKEVFGALPYIFGTLVTSVIALFVAVPLSVGTAVFLTEFAPSSMRQPLVSVIEMLAAVPSVIFGLWGFFVLVPWLRAEVYPWLQEVFGFLPFFQGPIYGVGILSAALVVAIMVLPIITSVSREILRGVPNLQREAAYALGATRWEVIRVAVLSYARPGLFGAAMLGLGRALGETMAVLMVIGNNPQIVASLFAPGDTLASVIANQFAEANTPLYSSALFEIGLVLLGVTVVTNVAARFLIYLSAPSGVVRA